ncbi:D-alanyl-D-alanine dipeptidase [Nostoc sp. MS1]|nr:D-alanyl-D-alanine dipeptidase [Nostoc sp. MS1]
MNKKALSTADVNSPKAIPDNSTNNSNINPVSNDDTQLVDIQTVNKDIVIDIRYATTNNFLKQKVYPEARCVLRYGVAKKLSQIQQDLSRKQLGLKVYDCYRPLSVQKLMWRVIPDERYVANPAQGSRHNRGAAVDLTLIDNNGKELEMPSKFDSFTPASHRNYNGGSAQARKNRQLLEDTMQKQGFSGLSTEWWHFDASDWQNFPVMDVPFNDIPKVSNKI